MMFYSRGYKDGRADANKELERVLAVLREELSRKQHELDAAHERVAVLTDKLTLVNELGQTRLPAPVVQTGMTTGERIAASALMRDTFEDLPFGHPDATFARASDAALFDDQKAS